MPRAVEVFTPNDVPTFTYVERANHKFETRLREAFEIRNMIVSLSGPSKSGKTVLVHKVVEKDNLIPVSGASIKSAEDLWVRVLGWMDSPIKQSEKNVLSFNTEIGAKAGGTIGVPFFAEGKAEGEGKIGGEKRWESEATYERTGLPQVIREIGGSSFTVFVDDFHYIGKQVQVELGKQIKEAAENGVRICTASVPHRADDVVRSNPELRGRVIAIDVDRWKDDEVEQIAYHGFRELNIDIAPPILKRLGTEAFGSPQLMQAICLNFCFENKIAETLPEQKRIDMDFVALQNVLERTSTFTDFSSMLSVLHDGPKLRGTERKEFNFTDGSRGDIAAPHNPR